MDTGLYQIEVNQMRVTEINSIIKFFEYAGEIFAVQIGGWIFSKEMELLGKT